MVEVAPSTEKVVPVPTTELEPLVTHTDAPRDEARGTVVNHRPIRICAIYRIERRRDDVCRQLYQSAAASVRVGFGSNSAQVETR